MSVAARVLTLIFLASQLVATSAQTQFPTQYPTQYPGTTKFPTYNDGRVVNEETKTAVSTSIDIVLRVVCASLAYTTYAPLRSFSPPA